MASNPKIEVNQSSSRPAGVVDTDIEQHLRDAYLNSVRSTDEYKLGRIEERQSAHNDEMRRAKERILPAAETFLLVAKQTWPDLKIVAFRIGVDYSSGAPVALMVVSAQNADLLPNLRKLARAIERFAWDELGCEGYLWSLVDKSVQQPMVEQDFPFYRTSL